MAKKKDRLDWGGYLNMRLSPEQKKDFETWYREMGDDVWELFIQTLMEGMKVSFVYDPDNDTYTVSLMNSPRCTCGVNALYVLSAYAQDWRVAVALVLYKHYQSRGGDLGTLSPFQACP